MQQTASIITDPIMVVSFLFHCMTVGRVSNNDGRDLNINQW